MRPNGLAQHLATSPQLTVLLFALILLAAIWTTAAIYDADYAAATLCSLVILGFAAVITSQLGRLRRYAVSTESSLNKIRSAGERSLDAMYMLRGVPAPDGRIVDFVFTSVNQRGAELLMLPVTNVLGRKLSDLLPQFRRNGQLEKYVKAIHSDRPLEEEFENTAPQLKGHWFHQQLVPIGDLKSLQVFLRDITDHKNTEIRIRNSRAFLQSLIDHLPLLVYARDIRAGKPGRMLLWNRTAELVTGYTGGDVLSKTDEQVFPPAIVAQFRRLDIKMQTDPMVVDLPEMEFQRADGVIHYLRVISVPLFDDNDRLEHVLGIAEDITGQRKQALALRTKQAELIAANEASPLGLFRTDENGQWTYVNRTYEDISGRDRACSLGDGWTSAIHPDDRDAVVEAWSRSLQERLPSDGVYRMQHPDGQIVWVSTRSAPIIVDDQLHGYVGSVDDITTRRSRKANSACAPSPTRCPHWWPMSMPANATASTTSPTKPHTASSGRRSAARPFAPSSAKRSITTSGPMSSASCAGKACASSRTDGITVPAYGPRAPSFRSSPKTARRWSASTS